MLRPRQGERLRPSTPRLVGTGWGGSAAITPERQPLATPRTGMRSRFGQALPMGRDPPVQAETRGLDLLGGDPESPWTRLAAGVRERDRASPIVVHSEPGHKGFVTG
ncbi:conserved hypothetical protein [Streptomyces albidoflavus]|nr:conserved hypothetical protein [Streptomyces albidoflavus]